MENPFNLADMLAKIEAGQIPDGFEEHRCKDCGAIGFVPADGKGEVTCYSLRCFRKRKTTKKK
jgi:hypothetical protein